MDPQQPLNAVIQDIELAPRNARGLVEYSTDVDILQPTNMAPGNPILFFNVVNRGNKGGLPSYNARMGGDVAAINQLATPGDGFMMREGYTIVWFGWQADVLPGNNRMTMQVPPARNSDGTPITGIVRSEIVVATPTTTVNLSTGYFTQLTHASYPDGHHRQPHAARGWIRPDADRTRARAGATSADSEHRLVFRRLPGRRHPAAERNPDLLHGRVPTRPAVRADLSREGPARARPRLCRVRDLAAFFKHEPRDG